jgi:PAS domain S-box-containing protein
MRLLQRHVKRPSTPLALDADFFDDCIRALSGPYRDAAMVLDETGRVLYCNPEGAALFGQGTEQLTGRQLSDFVLNSELDPWSPEKNMAYARFAGKRNQWREYCVLDSCGCGSRLEILLDEMTVELHQLMLLWVRRPAQPARVADPAEKLSTRAATQA